MVWKKNGSWVHHISTKKTGTAYSVEKGSVKGLHMLNMERWRSKKCRIIKDRLLFYQVKKKKEKGKAMEDKADGASYQRVLCVVPAILYFILQKSVNAGKKPNAF